MAKIFHAHLHGDRVTKYDRLMHSTISDTAWSEISPQIPFYLLIPHDTQLLGEYQRGWKITDVMLENSLGCLTKRDKLVTGITHDEVKKKIESFIDSDKTDQQAVDQFDLRLTDNDMWDAEVSRISVQIHNIDKYIRKESFRPFDNRYIFYHEKFIARLNRRVMRHLDQDNLAFVTVRQLATLPFDHIWTTDQLADQHLISVRTKEGGVVLPLYLYPETEEKELGITRRPNLSQPFLNDINDRLGYTPTPEAIFHYIYAVFHSPTYRSRYAEFLKIDFPRVPLTRNDALFRQLASYGEELVALHLMKSAKLEQKSKHPQFVEQEGNYIVEPGHPKYDVQSRSVIINKKGDRFTNVPEAVWNFYVGGYPVCAKWLKDRKGRTLSPQDIAHYQQIVVALGETITLMAAIDQAIPGFPIE
jgi:predicted helicase